MDKPFLIPITNNIDERGEVYGITQWVDEAFKNKVKDTRDLYRRIYTVKNWQMGQIRAFHGHKTSSTIIHIISGAAKINVMPLSDFCGTVYEEEIAKVQSFTLAANKPSLLYVPPGYYNGHISLTNDTQYLVLSSCSIEQVKEDDVRVNWDKLGPSLWEISRK